MESKKLTIKDSSVAFLSAFLLSQLAIVIVTIIAIFICSIANIDSSSYQTFFNTSYGYLILAATMYLVITLTFLVINKKKDNPIISKPSVKKIFIYIAIAIISFFVLYPIITTIDTWLIDLGIQLNTIPYELTTTNYFISLISMVLLPAVCEELLFRGLVFKGLKPYGKVFSITISALIFAIYHMSIDQTIYPFLFGLLLSVIMYKENNILYCIAMHFTNNFLSLTFSYFKINFSYAHWTYILIAFILVIAFLAIVLYFTIKGSKNIEKEKISMEGKAYFYICLVILIIIYILSLIQS